MKVGDLVKFESVLNDSMDHHTVEHGLVMQLSKTGHDTLSAQVLFNDGDTWWVELIPDGDMHTNSQVFASSWSGTTYIQRASVRRK